MFRISVFDHIAEVPAQVGYLTQILTFLNCDISVIICPCIFVERKPLIIDALNNFIVYKKNVKSEVNRFDQLYLPLHGTAISKSLTEAYSIGKSLVSFVPHLDTP